MIQHSRKLINFVEDKEVWDSIVKQFSQADVYFTYEYCKWAAETEGGTAKLVYFKNEKGSIIYPIIIRSINMGQKDEVYDITTPYGYGGPILKGDPETINEFKEAFYHYCLNNRIVSEIIRVHPLVNNKAYLSKYCSLQYVRQTTAVNLKPSLEKIREGYSKMNKRNIKKAVKNNLICKEVEKTAGNIHTFYELYKETMNRKYASPYYFFDQESLSKQMNNSNVSNAHLIFVYSDNAVVSAVILFTSNKLAHYHLGASDENYLYLRPNNLVFDYMVKISKESGCTLLNLGGGYSENDNLFLYKTSFSNGNNYSFYIGKNIFNEELYRELELFAGVDNSLSEGFFPSYRTPVRERIQSSQ
ncbi:lipid II:glycine glycyltransferase FemX [Alkalicoccus halolimnae]|uniref:Lipid II:glycine glycyltransferase n=1 Tax=Alkalicoccus halolimnae TaxID=1667239 RepID=A0AAJ8LTZ8_9BACI|nr:GNAT family N-acetyltransferase [Alkalicoccus halolimnae]